MKPGDELVVLETADYKAKTRASEKLVAILPDVLFFEGKADGVTRHFLTIGYHNGSECEYEFHPKAWETVLELIKEGDQDKLWTLLHSWGIYRG